MKKYKVVILGPNNLSGYFNLYIWDFKLLKYKNMQLKFMINLKTITNRFSRHFDNILILRKKLEEAMNVVDSFGKDARSISRTLENIKDPEQVEIATKTENVEKFVDRSKQLKINLISNLNTFIK